MGRLDQLAKLAAIAAIPRHASLEDLMAACEIVRGALGADEVYVIQAADPHFAKLGAAGPATEYEIKQKGYWIVRRTLAGAPAEEATDGASAISRLRGDAGGAGRPDVVLMDCSIPDLDVRALVRAMVDDSKRAAPPLVVLSPGPGASPDAVDLAGVAVGQLTKPVRPTRLREALRFALRADDVSRVRPRTPSIPPAAAGTRLRSLRILVAEDNLVNQRLAVRMLEKAGHRVDLTANGRDAVEALGRAAYDLVLMDCRMPEMDGFEATRAMRAAEQGTDRHIPIVALTANAMQGDREKCLEAGMDDYLAKPFTKQTLATVLARWET